MKSKRIFIAILSCIVLAAFFVIGTIETKAASFSSRMTIKSVKNNGSGIKVKWKKKSKVSGYIIYRKKENGKLVKYDTVKGSTHYLDEDVETGVLYKYSVKAYKTKKGKKKYSKSSLISKEVKASPFSATLFSAKYKGTSYINFTWKTNSYASGYYIYRSTDKKNWNIIADTEENIDFYKDYTIEGGKNYYYKVRSYEIVDGERYNGVLPKIYATPTGEIGIDVSYHNGTINWGKVEKSGVNFAMIRAAYGDNKKGGVTDPKFKENIKNAKANGVKVGVYIYSYARNTTHAKREAKYMVKLLKKIW